MSVNVRANHKEFFSVNALIQRVTFANVMVDNQIIGEIATGILVLLGIEKTDTESCADHLLEKIINYRIFEDAQEKMNLSVKDVNGGLLFVPQFTLAAETNKGTRPGFSTAMAPSESEKIFLYLVTRAKEIFPTVACGKFGAYMQVNLCNDGPVTFFLRSN